MAYRVAIYSMVHWIKGELYAKNQGPDSRDEKVICILSNLKDKHTDIVAYRGGVVRNRDEKIKA